MSRRPMSEDSASIKLSAGGSITLTHRGSLFDLSADERRLLNDLSAILQRHRDGAGLTEAKTPVEHLKE